MQKLQNSARKIWLRFKSWEYFNKFIFISSLIILSGIVFKLSFPEVIKVRIVQRPHDSLDVYLSGGDISTFVSGSIDADVNGSVDTQTTLKQFSSDSFNVKIKDY